MELETFPPSILKFVMTSKVSEDILAAGNRNNAPSDVILRKISSESIQRKDLDEEFFSFSYKLRNQYKSDAKYQGNVRNGFIQELSIKPFYVTMYTETVLLYVLELSKKNTFKFYWTVLGP